MPAEKTGETPSRVAQGPPQQFFFDGREWVMKCEHLTISRAILSCRALGRRYLPSQFEIEEYCKTDAHKKCPLCVKRIVFVDHPEGDERPALA
jgi:hypothetical protein